MSVFKCKMCGGNLQISENTNIATCEYCGTNQTISKSRDEVITNLYNRANDLRIKCEFDRAEQIYEKILEQDNTEAEAHWGIVLCRFGIVYVKDPKTEQMIPTCHRTSYESVITDADYLSAIKYGDNKQKEFYISEAEIIDKIQKKALDIVRNEDPFDVFICYKETDENGKRTVDSTLANDIYYQLTQEGYKVFYAPITLEDKIGKEYEPYIFAALNSAKVMLVLGTKPEYFNAVWVKNEWSRYLKLIREDRSKLLIPCYRDMNAYDLPDEFAHLQAQDMSKIGFIQDLIWGIKKVVINEEKPIPNKFQSFHHSKSSNIKHSSSLNRKLTMAFSIIASTSFFLTGLAIGLTPYYYTNNIFSFFASSYQFCHLLEALAFITLGIFVLKKKQNIITILLLIITLIIAFKYSESSLYWIVITYIPFIIFNIFRKQILKIRLIQFIALLLPLGYAYMQIRIYFGFFGIATAVLPNLGMFAYTLYLIEETKA